MNEEITDKKFNSIYNSELKKIEAKLKNVIGKREPESLYKPCKYALESGGKRLRPFLVLISAKAVGGKFIDVYNAALALEILHNFTLIHDDIMDNADLRRGRPTVHKKFDSDTAILAGDSLIAFAYRMLLKDCRNNSINVMNRFTNGIIEVCEGQSYDKEFESKKNVSIKEYKLMIRKKTAALAETCCAIGAELGGGSKDEINNLAVFGRNLGMAFQLQDDFLDIFGDTNKFGKVVGGDLIEGKKTFLFLKAFESSKGKEREELEKVIRNKGIKKNQVQKYKNLYLRLNVLENTKKEINRYSDIALKAADKVKDSESKKILKYLVGTLVNRIK